MHAAEGILTTRGGMTSHAAVVARGMGKPCVSGAGAIRIDYAAQTMTAGGVTLKKGDILTIDGGAGEVHAGRGADGEARDVRRIRDADGLGGRGAAHEGARQRRDADRRARRRVRSAPRASASAAPSTCSSTASASCAVREMILADDEQGRRAALAKLLPMQRAGFRRAVRDHERPAGHDPAARSAAARVPAARPTRRSTEVAQGDGRRAPRSCARAPRSCTKSIRCSASAACGSPSAIPRSPRCRRARSSRARLRRGARPASAGDRRKSWCRW